MQDGFLHMKPFILYNIGGFFHHLLEFLKAISQTGFADPVPFIVVDNNEELAEKYLNLFANKSGIEKSHIQRWIPIVAATQMTKGIPEEQEFLSKWVNVVDYE